MPRPRPGSGTLGSPKPLSTSGHRLVAYLPQDMEWHKRHAPLKRAIHHCVRGVGLWSNVRQSVVSTPMAGELVHSCNYPQRAGTHCYGSNLVGPLLGRETGPLSLRQHICRGGGKQGCRQRPSALQPPAHVGVRHGCARYLTYRAASAGGTEHLSRCTVAG